MEKIKKVLEENRVLLVLAIILVICLVVFGIVAITFFYGSSDNVYGNRLDKTKEVPLNKKLLSDIESTLESNESVKETKATLKGKIVYVNIEFVDATKMDDAKKVAEEVITLFNEDELEVYDIQFTITSLSTADFKGYTLMGARNSSGNGTLVWNNYNIEEESSAEE